MLFCNPRLQNIIYKLGTKTNFKYSVATYNNINWDKEGQETGGLYELLQLSFVNKPAINVKFN